MHNNMITINGKKMGKSYNNFITLEQFFTGDHELLTKPFSPMTIRFFILQAHYRSTVDFSSEALEAAEKGFLRMQETYARLLKLQASAETQETIAKTVASLRQQCQDAMDDDLNSQVVISLLFDSAHAINTVHDGKGTISAEDLKELQSVWKTFAIDILGLRLEGENAGNEQTTAAYKGAVDLLLRLRQEAKEQKNWATSDRIRNQLAALGFQIKDRKDGFEWTL
jgi:cysteinyl-tRNA synthetase